AEERAGREVDRELERARRGNDAEDERPDEGAAKAEDALFAAERRVGRLEAEHDLAELARRAADAERAGLADMQRGRHRGPARHLREGLDAAGWGDEILAARPGARVAQRAARPAVRRQPHEAQE